MVIPLFIRSTASVPKRCFPENTWQASAFDALKFGRFPLLSGIL